MKSKLLIAGVATLAVATTAYAHAGDGADAAATVPAMSNDVGNTGASGIYLSGQVGATLTPSQKFDQKNTSNWIKSKYKAPGWDVGIAGGYKYQNWRGELAVSYMQTTNKDIETNATSQKSASGITHIWNYMLNGYYDIDTGTPFVPYVGLGAGYTNVNYNLKRGDTIGTEKLSGSDTMLSYQGIVGFGYQFNPNMRASLEYRYLGTTQGDFTARVNGNNNDVKSDFTNNIINLGFTYMFGS